MAQHIPIVVRSDQNVFANLMITILKSGAQRLFDHPIYTVYLLMMGF